MEMKNTIIKTENHDQVVMYEFGVDSDVKGIVQIVHGMCEHIGRYRDFATFVQSQGYVVIGFDQFGHGKTVEKKVNQNNYYGYLGKDAFSRISKAIDHCFENAVEKYGEVPKILIGHSLGSYIVKYYLIADKHKVSQVILIGTGYNKLESKLGKVLAYVLGKFFTDTKHSRLLFLLTISPFQKAFSKDGVNGWLSRNVLSTQNYENDPLCGFQFTINGYYEMFKGIDDFFQVSNINYHNKIYLITGLEDPSNHYGKGMGKCANYLESKHKINTTEKYYPNMRHEVLNEIEKNKVYSDILDIIGNNH